MNARKSDQISQTRSNTTPATEGFSLIELLTVVAIIGVLTSLVIGLSGLASSKNKEFRAKGELNSLITGIESYKLEIGAYPPDGNRPGLGTDDKSKFLKAAYNPLFYELSGATFSNEGTEGFFTTLNKSERVRSSELKTVFGISGIQNSARDKFDVKYKGSTFTSSQHAELDEVKDVEVLVAPLPPVGDQFLAGKINLDRNVKSYPKLNPWLYDSSSTNRHNRRGFDLWIQYRDGKKTNIISNWK